MIQCDLNFENDSILPVVIHPPSDPVRGQVQFCHNLIESLFEKGNSPCKQEFPEVKIRRHILDHYLPGISNITLHHGLLLKLLPPQPANHSTHRIQTDDVELPFSNVFTEYIKNIHHQISQRANSIFANKVFALIYSYVSILESNDTFYVSPLQTSRQAKVKHEINLFSQFSESIRETITNNDLS